MSGHYILLCLSAVLLVQCSFGKSLTSKDVRDSFTSPTLKNEPSPVTIEFSVPSSYEKPNNRIKLLIFVLREFETLLDRILESGEKLLKDVVTEASEKEEKSEGVLERIDEYSKLIEKLETLKHSHNELNDWEESGQIFIAAEEFSLLIIKSNVTALEHPSSEDQLFHDLLNEHGLEKIEKEFEDKFMLFSDKFIQKADDFWQSLSNKEQQEDSDFNEWFENYKVKNDVEAKYGMFEEFFKLYIY